MLPSDLNLSMGKTKGYNNKVLVSNTDMKIGSNQDINKDHKKLPVTPPDDDMPKIVVPVVQRDNPKVLTEKHNDEELVITLLIVGAGLTAYHFWQEINCIIIVHNRCAVVNALAFSGTNFVFSRLTNHGEEEPKEMIQHSKGFKGQGMNGIRIE